LRIGERKWKWCEVKNKKKGEGRRTGMRKEERQWKRRQKENRRFCHAM